MRVAETRAVNRALRKAYGIGICSADEIGSFAESAPSARESKKLPPQPVNRKNGNYGGPKVRDRLCHDPPASAGCQRRKILVLAYSRTKARASYRMSVAALKPGSWRLRAYHLFENKNTCWLRFVILITTRRATIRSQFHPAANA
jgi:hypothetical protein